MTKDKVIRRQVISILREILSDPDAGLELTAYAKRRLAKSQRSKAAGRVKPLFEVLRMYGL
ncbi:hypothetical protein A3D11_01650 [Candidatus Peribacteria bacterium RIFCSPHIGHO2_02_FULL_49_16]|nr:MAG: hypothetical protein A3D11_01650 [Candidatus Peribacteria bacterium RIFCSPHIGHO2_02_FULL_49_16]